MNDIRGPGLPLLMAVCIALLVGGVLAMTWWKQPSAAELREQLSGPPQRPQPATSGPRTFRSRSPRLSMPLRPPTDARVEELRRELDQARAQIDRLEDFRLRYRARFPAEADVDWSGALDAIGREAASLLPGSENDALPASSASPDASSPVAAPNEPADADELARRLRDLQSRLEIAQFLDEQQRLENEELRSDLAEMAASLAQEIERTTEITARLESEQLLLDEASRALITLGAAAVPRLLAALGDEDPHIREWAADVLGAMGGAAESALPDLMEAVSDSDPAVRAAIRRAINTIERAE